MTAPKNLNSLDYFFMTKKNRILPENCGARAQNYPLACV